jgi:hypothetical protein
VTAALTIIAGIPILILAASRIPLTAAVFLRSCITLITALEDLREAMHQPDSEERKHIEMRNGRAGNP